MSASDINISYYALREIKSKAAQLCARVLEKSHTAVLACFLVTQNRPIKSDRY